MIFVGDIAIPSCVKPKLGELPGQISKQIVVANLEGLIAAPDMVTLSDTKLFSNDYVIEFLKCCNVKAVTLGNNHVTDVPEAFSRTKALLDENDISYCGAGLTLEEAQKPVVMDDSGVQYALLSFGWDVISCKYAGDGNLGVNPLTTNSILHCITETKRIYPNARIIIIPHWDYELERYPMPMHRELAKTAIDAGAFAVIGHHPHCVQGIEIYKDRPIIYSLGNWFIPDSVFMCGRTAFPQYAKLQMAVEITDQIITLHWFKYDANTQSLAFIESEVLRKSQKISELTAFSGLSQTEYAVWFRKNRVKKKLLPIFVQNDATIDSRAKALYVKHRQVLINIAFRKHIINRSMKASHEKNSRD